jgi:Fe-Mn family superoxide dismutase
MSSPSFTLPPLPYADTALDPVISAKTISFHYGKHHKAYVDKLNELAAGSEYADMPLEEVVKKSSGPIFNNAGQIWNHTFFWNSLSPNGGQPSGQLAAAIDSDLGGLEKFKKDFAAAGIAQFGSGWAWLVLDGGKLKIEKTPNAETPLTAGKTCILTIDVWEHAYYLDYQNRRPDYLNTVIEKLLNWNFAAENFSRG